MDFIQELTHFWAELTNQAPMGVKAYIVRMGIGMLAATALAVQLVRQADFNVSLRMRQIAVVTVMIFIVVLTPGHLIESFPETLQTVFITLCLLLMFFLPYFLIENLVRTYGRQILARRVLYSIIIIGFFTQLAISGGQ